ncbi:MAG: hypothetical protein OXU75_18315 [Deltaproteobacteria bacterium]|nr:hypothetical protein [Deltaproteobacteria bacterium]
MNRTSWNRSLDLVRALAVLVTLFAAAPASADSIDTRFSELEIVERGHDFHELISNGREKNWHPARPVEGTRNWRLVFETLIYWRRDADVVVLRRLENNNYCGGQYQFVLVPATGHEQASKPGPACSGSILQMRVSPRAIELDVVPIPIRPDLSHLTLRYDGSEMEEIEVPRDDSRARIAGAGKDVTRWIGVHPAEILDDATERRRFATIMTPAELYDLVRNTRAAYPAESRLANGFLVARGCSHPSCQDMYGAIAIELATGRPYALIYNRETGLKVYGSSTLAKGAESLQNIAAEWLSGKDQRQRPRDGR